MRSQDFSVPVSARNRRRRRAARPVLPMAVLLGFVGSGLHAARAEEAGAGRDVQLDFSAGSRVAGKTPPRLFLSAGISKRF